MSVKAKVSNTIIDWILWIVGVGSISFVIWACFTQPIFVYPEEPKPQEVTIVNNYNICFQPQPVVNQDQTN